TSADGLRLRALRRYGAPARGRMAAGGAPCRFTTGLVSALVAYQAGSETAAYLEPVAVGDRLSDMPLFLSSDVYISVPLEETYQAAWDGARRPGGQSRRWVARDVTAP